MVIRQIHFQIRQSLFCQMCFCSELAKVSLYAVSNQMYIGIYRAKVEF